MKDLAPLTEQWEQYLVFTDMYLGCYKTDKKVIWGAILSLLLQEQ